MEKWAEIENYFIVLKSFKRASKNEVDPNKETYLNNNQSIYFIENKIKELKSFK